MREYSSSSAVLVVVAMVGLVLAAAGAGSPSGGAPPLSWMATRIGSAYPQVRDALLTMPSTHS